MRRAAIILAIFAILIAAQIASDHTGPDRWRAVPGGGKIRFVGVTYDGKGEIKFERSIFETLRDRLGPRWSVLLGPEPLDRRFLQSLSGLRIVFLQQGNDVPLNADHFTLEVDGKRLRWNGFNGVSSSNRDAISLGFNSATPAVPRFHIRWSKDEHEGAVDFDIPNPFYQPPSDPNFAPKPSPPKPS